MAFLFHLSFARMRIDLTQYACACKIQCASNEA